MNRFISYLKFLLTSKNQHGVHSPFIYNYITQCLCFKPSYPVTKTLEVLLKSIHYFDAKKIEIISDGDFIKHRIKKEFPSIELDTSPFDIIYIDKVEPRLISIYFIGKYNDIHNDTMILINNIHKNSTSEKLWKTIKKSSLVTVTVDMFYCGAVFFRKEQAKEHFRIRI